MVIFLALAGCVLGLFGEPRGVESLLSAEQYETRELGSAILRQQLAYAPYDHFFELRNHFAASPSPEVRHRALLAEREAQGARRVYAAALIDRRYTDFPYLDSLWYDPNRQCYCRTDPLYRFGRRYLKYTAGEPHVPADKRPHPTYRTATRAMFIDLYCRGVSLDVLDWLMNDIRSRDDRYLAQYGLDPLYMPPAKAVYPCRALLTELASFLPFPVHSTNR